MSLNNNNNNYYICNSLFLHELVFRNSIDELRDVLENGDKKSKLKYNINAQDRFGNTPLIIAVQLGHTECIRLLLSHGAVIKIRNISGWSAINEAVSRGDRDIIKLLWSTYKLRSAEEFKHKLPDIMNKIRGIKDFHLVIEWKFSSWIPLLGRILPSDTYHIYKYNTKLRLETTIKDFSNLSWIRGDLAFIFELDEKCVDNQGKPQVKITAIDGDKKVYARLNQNKNDKKHNKDNKLNSNNSDNNNKNNNNNNNSNDTNDNDDIDDCDDSCEELEEELDHLQSSPITDISNPGKLQFVRARSGIWPWRSDKCEIIDNYNCRVFNVKNIEILTRKRFEHMSPEEKTKRIQMNNLLSNGKELEAKMAQQQEKSRLRRERKANKLKQTKQKADNNDNNNEQDNNDDSSINECDNSDEEEKVVHKTSLPAPKPSDVTFQQYFQDNYILTSNNNIITETNEDDNHTNTNNNSINNTHNNNNDDESNIDDVDDSSKVNENGVVVQESVPVIISTNSAAPNIIHLGREIELKEEKKKYSASVWMCDNFPLTIETVVNLLEIAAPQHKHVRKFKNFLASRLPPGFPIRIHMPVFPTISATITFVDYSDAPIDPNKFIIPNHFKHDKKAFDKLAEQHQQTNNNNQT